MASAYITTLATGIWQDLGDPTDITATLIESKLVSEYFIGKLNVSISTSYDIVSGDISPALGVEEQGIYSTLYKSNYYAQKITKLLAGYTVADAWIEMSDGDGSVRRASPTELARTLKDVKNSLDAELIRLIHSYRMNNSNSQSVDYYSIENRPRIASPSNDHRLI